MGVTRLLANEWAKHNINASTPSPRGIWRPAAPSGCAPSEQRSGRKSSIAFPPGIIWGLPTDLMGPVVFLASSASDYINGYTVAVDGGWLAR
ncbi:SDR family oxidoreductase [Klebsiella pneumoniae]|nr:SDR family oxidoreductase [Klebsiella pneumoniae]